MRRVGGGLGGASAAAGGRGSGGERRGGSVVAEFGEVVFFEAEVVADFVEDGDADLGLEFGVADEAGVVCGRGDDAEPVDHDVIGHAFDRGLDGPFGERDPVVESAEFVGGFKFERVDDFLGGVVLDDEGDLFEQLMDIGGESTDHAVEQVVEMVACGGVHGRNDTSSRKKR